MLLKLTHKGKPTLVNTSNIVTMFNGYDKESRTHMTTLTLVNGYTLFVDEALQEVYEIIKDVLSGKEQNIDWTFTPPSIDERFDQSFNGYERPQQNFNRQPQYQQRRSYNDRW